MTEQSAYSFYESHFAKVIFAVISATFYFFAFQLNASLFDSLTFSHGVNWIFIPSGLRLLFVLVLVVSGSAGIFMATCALSLTNGSSELNLFNIVTALISGFAPLIARQVCVDYLNIGKNLSNLTSKSLLQISIVFALISSVLHQVWFFWNGVTSDFTASLLVMATGDWFGTALVLAIASLLISAFRAFNSY